MKTHTIIPEVKDYKEATKKEIQFLEGPQSRWKDFKYVVSVSFQFIKGFRALHFVGPCVTVFGSARFKEDSEYYKQTRELSGQIALLGFTIMTGGGPGIMEAANKGAYEAGGLSIGCNIELPFEQHLNPYVQKSVTMLSCCSGTTTVPRAMSSCRIGTRKMRPRGASLRDTT